MNPTIDFADDAGNPRDSAAVMLENAVEWFGQTAPRVAEKALEIYNTAEGIVAGNMAASTIAIGVACFGVLENVFGPIVRENEVALFRSRNSERLIPLTSGRYGLHRWFLLLEVNPPAGVVLNTQDSAGAFRPASLVNERGRFSLSTFIYEIADEAVQTSDGAIVLASGSVSFRLDAQHINAFVNFALGSFAESFRQRVRSAVYNEIGRQRRDAVIGHQTASCRRVEDELIRTSEGPPGANEESGLGIVIERVNLLVGPESMQRDEGSQQDRLENGALVTIDTIRWLNEMIKQEDVVENRQFLREAFGSYMEASRTIEVARQLGASGNLIVATPDETGLTKGAAAAVHLQAKDRPPTLKLIETAANQSA